jgi:hypothetical protein
MELKLGKGIGWAEGSSGAASRGLIVVHVSISGVRLERGISWRSPGWGALLGFSLEIIPESWNNQAPYLMNVL